MGGEGEFAEEEEPDAGPGVDGPCFLSLLLGGGKGVSQLFYVCVSFLGSGLRIGNGWGG